MQGRRRETHLIEVVELTIVGEFRVRPESLDDVDALLEVFLARGRINSESTVFVSVNTPSETYVQPTSAYRVHGRGVLGEANRVVERGYQDAGAESNLLGAPGDVGGYDQRGGADAVTREVVLGYPGAAETQVFGQADLVRRVR